jgi:hypothetical protein
MLQYMKESDQQYRRDAEAERAHQREMVRTSFQIFPDLQALCSALALEMACCSTQRRSDFSGVL